jgi:hypothetical protein
MSTKLIIDVAAQKARLYEGRRLKEVFNISTAKNGLGNVAGSNCTPTPLFPLPLAGEVQERV